MKHTSERNHDAAPSPSPVVPYTATPSATESNVWHREQHAAANADEALTPGATAPLGATPEKAVRPLSALPTIGQPLPTAGRIDSPDFHDPAATTVRPAAIPAATGFAQQEPADRGHKDKISPQQGGPARRKHRGGKIAVGVIAGALVLLYAAGAAAFSQLYYPGTSIANQDISFKRADDAASLIENSLNDYALSVTGDGVDVTFTHDEGKMVIDADDAARDMLAHNQPLLWPYRLAQSLLAANQPDQIKDEAAGLSVTYDEQALEAKLGGAIDALNENRTGTFDSAGAYDESAGKFTVEKARANQKLDRDAIIAAAKDAIAHLSPSLTLDKSSYQQFANGATDEQLQHACDEANGIIGVNVSLTMGGVEVATLDGKQLMQWITFDDALAPKLDANALTPWISNLAKQLDTVGTERTYTRGDGKQVTVKGGSWGWVSNEAKLAELLQNAVDTKQQGTIEIPTKQTADTYQGLGKRDWGAYIDVDLSEQHARYYDANNNLLWESGCISGNPNKGNETPTGVYQINSNNGGATLVGKKDPKTGEPEYKTPVKYWMPFVGGSVGLHDADWQSASNFSNPKAYTWVGSHGCVNLPPDKAAELSGMIKVGTCVITHY